MGFNAQDEIKRIIDGIDPEWSNLKKARYITIEICKMYRYNPEYNYADEETKAKIFGDSFSSKLDYANSGTDFSNRDITYLNMEDQEKICVGLQQIYSHLLSLAQVDHDTNWGSNIYINYKNGEQRGFLQKLVADLYTVKSKKTPEGFFLESDMDPYTYSKKMEELKQVDMELGYIDENGYIGDNALGSVSANSNLGVETILNNVADYLRRVLKTNISGVELHKYYKYILKTAMPNKRIYIIPFSDPGRYADVRYLIESKKVDEYDQTEFFLYDETSKKFCSISALEVFKTMQDKQVLTSQGKKHKEELLNELEQGIEDR